MTPARASNPTANLRFLAGAVAAGFALNCIKLEVVGDAYVFLGVFLLTPFLISNNALWSALAAMVAMVPSLFVEGHPFSLFLAGMEGLWLSLGVYHGRKNAILVDAAFWLVAGLPLGLWWYGGVLKTPHDLTWVLLSAKAVASILAAAAGLFVMRYTSVGSVLSGDKPEAGSVREVIFNYVFVLSLAPLVFITVGISILNRSTVDEEASERAFFSARDATKQTDMFFDLHQAALLNVAHLIERNPGEAPVLIQELQRAYPRFLTMLTTDAAGRITHTAPGPEFASLRGSSVADRSYFQKARDTGRPFVSEVFRGRGFGDDILVAMSVPIRDAEGRFQGIVEGSIEVNRFAQVVASRGEHDGIQLVFADTSGRVIYADGQTGLTSLQLLQTSSLKPALQPLTGGTSFRADRVEPDGTVRRVSNRVLHCRNVGIIVIAQWPVLGALEQAKTTYAMILAMLFGIAVTAALVARAAHRRLSAPLESFIRHAEQQTQAGGLETYDSPSRQTPREVTAVFETFNRIAKRLNVAHAELQEQNSDLDRRVTERTKEADTLRQAAESSNQSKTDFLAMTGHEIRTPLNAIIGLTDIVAANPQAPETAARLQTIQASSQRLLGVVNDLLDLSRAEAGKLELMNAPVDLRTISVDILEMFALQAASKGLKIGCNVRVEAPLWLNLDAPRLQQVLINLVGNALKFTRQGSVTVEIGIRQADPEKVSVHFAVIDTGPGISPAEQTLLFQPYVQLRAAGPEVRRGTGLGLAISRRLVGLFGGELGLRSDPGRGSEFFFVITAPRATPPVAEVPVETPKVAARAGRVLAVDDNSTNRELLEAMIEGQCERLLIVASGAEALAAAAREEFDVALIDLEMPDMDGLQVARAIRASKGNPTPNTCRLVAFTAYGRNLMWSRCAEAGFDDFVDKPINRAKLWAALEGRNLANGI